MLQILIALIGIAGLLLLLLGSIYGVAGLVAFAIRYAPLVGRRHRTGPRLSREPTDTESAKVFSDPTNRN